MSLRGKERQSRHAGAFYPKDPDRLREDIDSLLGKCKRGHSLGHPKAALCPVAGYAFSGLAAASSFLALSAVGSVDRVILIANNLYSGPDFRGIALTDYAVYHTPVGISPVDRDFCQRLAEDNLFRGPTNVHEMDHRIEIQLPLLQRTMGDVPIVPMLVSELEGDDIAHIARIFREHLHSKSILVACAPLSTTYVDGFPQDNEDFQVTPRDFVYAIDQEAVNYIASLDYAAFRHYCQHRNRSMIRSEAIQIAMCALSGWCVGTPIDHYISADAPGAGAVDPNRGQSYASIVFYTGFFSETYWTSFISYSSRDKERVEKIAGDLHRSGINVWLDTRELRPGDSLNTRIQEAIGRSGYLVVFLSRASVRSPWVQRELNAALVKELEIRHVFVVPALLEDCEVPEFLRDKVYADFRKHYDTGLASLLSALRMPPRSERHH